MAWSELRLHRYLLELSRSRARGPLVGSRGHDAAVLRAPRGRGGACVDATVVGVHFEAGTPAARVARKALGRALSDLAATAARPRAVLLALQAPASGDEAYLRRLLRAVDDGARAVGAALVGGDLAAVPGRLALSVTALGELPGRRRPPGRDRARPGQAVLLTGPVGGSRLGRHLAVRPRLAEGAWLFARGATALMDVSDGLALDLSRLASLSGVRVELTRVPVHRDARRAAARDGRSALDHALGDGEDHELLATVPRAAVPRLLAERARHCPSLAVIGRVARGAGVFLEEEGERRPLAPEGFVHGGP